ncbi:MAG: DegT/DnrJ/EryC1/StrS family aminotransferase [Candidatus Neomarinimicrobiota bacterium]|tara:strand:+ start:342 stop:1496 length:1155 start_codon:yes stop_codon:yes gene_type:complete
MKIPFQSPNIPKNFEKIFPESVRSGWLTTGSQVNEFEKKIAEYLGVRHIIAVNSCTAALHLALAAKGFGMGQKFIIPTLTFASTIECGEYLGMEPILLDSSKNGFLMDLNQIEDIVRNDNSIKAIVPVHYAGESVNLHSIMEIANNFNLFVLQDAAHAFETEFNGNKIGNTNHAAAFSFYANKNLTTGGEGGALATNDSNLARRVKKLSLHGITKDGWNRFKTNGNWEYDIVEMGYKYNLTDYAACFGLWQMGQIDRWQKRRTEIVSKYNQGLSDIDSIILPNILEGHAKHLFVIRLDLDRWSISRNSFIEKMNERGVGLAVHYKPIHQLSYYKKKYDFNYNNFGVANSLYKSIVSLPIYPNLSNKSLDYIIENIKDLHNTYSK